MKIKDLDNIKNKETYFIPYEQKTKNAYFVYLAISIVLFLSVFIFSLFATINVSKYKLYNVKLTDFNYPILNLFYAPIVCLIAITVSMILLIFAPRVSIIVSSKYSSRMFYTAFWLLILSVMLSSEVQLTYISQSGILYNENYHWINPIIARIFIIFSLFLILITQLFFWIMRRKFTFMNSDYEIYTTRSMEKKQRRIRKQELKKIKKQEKEFSKKTLNIK
ncbi:hypothetical protein [Spiroplasma endosymbiont of Colias croceus]|uniref:hypothetical protein n=1 Tax=Spiroplasma endosymbiont of Colias croceus TaxID=3066310 RepID=UPI0030D409D7